MGSAEISGSGRITAKKTQLFKDGLTSVNLYPGDKKKCLFVDYKLFHWGKLFQKKKNK